MTLPFVTSGGRRFAALCGLIGLALLAGCSRAPETPQCVVSGIVLSGMTPAAELCLRFHAKDDPQRMLTPEAVWTEADGSFSLPVKKPGVYVVTAYWPQVTIVEGDRVEGDDRLRGKFAHVDRPLRTLTLEPGENSLPLINLQHP